MMPGGRKEPRRRTKRTPFPGPRRTLSRRRLRLRLRLRSSSTRCSATPRARTRPRGSPGGSFASRTAPPRRTPKTPKAAKKKRRWVENRLVENPMLFERRPPGPPVCDGSRSRRRTSSGTATRSRIGCCSGSRRRSARAIATRRGGARRRSARSTAGGASRGASSRRGRCFWTSPRWPSWKLCGRRRRGAGLETERDAANAGPERSTRWSRFTPPPPTRRKRRPIAPRKSSRTAEALGALALRVVEQRAGAALDAVGALAAPPPPPACEFFVEGVDEEVVPSRGAFSSRGPSLVVGPVAEEDEGPADATSDAAHAGSNAPKTYSPKNKPVGPGDPLGTPPGSPARRRNAADAARTRAQHRRGGSRSFSAGSFAEMMGSMTPSASRSSLLAEDGGGLGVPNGPGHFALLAHARLVAGAVSATRAFGERVATRAGRRGRASPSSPPRMACWRGARRRTPRSRRRASAASPPTPRARRRKKTGGRRRAEKALVVGRNRFRFPPRGLRRSRGGTRRRRRGARSCSRRRARPKSRSKRRIRERTTRVCRVRANSRTTIANETLRRWETRAVRDERARLWACPVRTAA